MNKSRCQVGDKERQEREMICGRHDERPLVLGLTSLLVLSPLNRGSSDIIKIFQSGEEEE